MESFFYAGACHRRRIRLFDFVGNAGANVGVDFLKDDFFPLGVEAQNVAYQPFTFGQLFHRDVFDMLAACGIAFPFAFEAGGEVA